MAEWWEAAPKAEQGGGEWWQAAPLAANPNARALRSELRQGEQQPWYEGAWGEVRDFLYGAVTGRETDPERAEAREAGVGLQPTPADLAHTALAGGQFFGGPQAGLVALRGLAGGAGRVGAAVASAPKATGAAIGAVEGYQEGGVKGAAVGGAIGAATGGTLQEGLRSRLARWFGSKAEKAGAAVAREAEGAAKELRFRRGVEFIPEPKPNLKRPEFVGDNPRAPVDTHPQGYPPGMRPEVPPMETPVYPTQRPRGWIKGPMSQPPNTKPPTIYPSTRPPTPPTPEEAAKKADLIEKQKKLAAGQDSPLFAEKLRSSTDDYVQRFLSGKRVPVGDDRGTQRLLLGAERLEKAGRHAEAQKLREAARAGAAPAAPTPEAPPPAKPDPGRAAVESHKELMAFARNIAKENPKVGEQIWLQLDDAGNPVKWLTPAEAGAAKRKGLKTTWVKNLWNPKHL